MRRNGPKGIPIFADLREAVRKTHPETLVIGVATEGGYIPARFRPIIHEAIEDGLNVAAGLHEVLGDDSEFATLAAQHGVKLIDGRRPRPMKDSHHFANATREGPGLWRSGLAPVRPVNRTAAAGSRCPRTVCTLTDTRMVQLAGAAALRFGVRWLKRAAARADGSVGYLASVRD